MFLYHPEFPEEEPAESEPLNHFSEPPGTVSTINTDMERYKTVFRNRVTLFILDSLKAASAICSCKASVN